MGVIRDGHISNGIYTKMDGVVVKGSRNTKLGGSSKTKEGGGTNVPQGFDEKERTIYYGYCQAPTKNGIATSSTIDSLKNLITSELVTTSSTFHKKLMVSSRFIIHDENDIIIPKECNVSSYNDYFTTADKHNKCFVLVVHQNKQQKIILNDCLFENTYDMMTLFQNIKDITINGQKYKVLVLFDKYFAYSPVNMDKIISQIKVIMK